MKRILIWISVLVVFATINMCSNRAHKTTRLSEDLKTIYQKGDTLIYKNNFNLTDTYIVKEIYTNFYLGVLSSEDAKMGDLDRVEHYSVVFKNIHDTTFHQIKSGNIKFFGEYEISWQNSPFAVIPIKIDTFSTFIINGEIYDHVFKVPINHNSIANGNIKVVYANFKYGVLQYEDQDSIIWHLEKIIKY